MRTTKFIMVLTFVAGIASLTSCNKSEGTMPDDDGSIRFTAGIGQRASADSRASGVTWDNNDQIGVFMIGNGGTQVVENALNKRFGYSGSSFTASSEADKIHFPMNGDNVDFIAYYPWAGGSMLTSAIPVTIGTAQTSASQPRFDLLWTKADNNGLGYDKATNKTTPVALMFEHKLSKLVMNVVNPSKAAPAVSTGLTDADLKGMEVNIEGMNTTNTFDLATGQLGTAGMPAVIIPRSISAIGDYGAAYDAIIMPGDYAEGAVKVLFTINPDTAPETFTWTLTATEFAAGNEYAYEVTLTRTGVDVTATIKPWVSNNRGEVTAE